MDDSGNGGKVENIRDFAAGRGRRQPRYPAPVDEGRQQPQGQHHSAHQFGGGPPAREGKRMNTLLHFLLWGVWGAMLGTWLRFVYEVFMLWGPL